MASSSAHTPECFASALSKVRRLSISSLPHQSRPAQLLVALEATVFGNSDVTPGAHNASAYLDALLQCLQRAYPDEGKMEIMGLGAVIPATLYLLAIVVPETPTRELLSKISPLLECLLPLYPTALERPPAIRSLLQITTFVLVVAPPALLNASPLLKKAWNHLLGLNLDPRPKVRHLAQEGVRQVLCTPVPPRTSAGAHPYLPRARGWVTSVLEEEAKSGGTSSKGKKARLGDGEDAEGKRAIWVVQGLRGWIAVWGNQHLSELCSLLLSLPFLAHLTPQIYSLLAHLLSPPPNDATGPKPSTLTNLPTILDSLLSSPPEIKSNASDLPSYLSALTSALIKMSLQDPVTLPSYLSKAFNLIFSNILLAPAASPETLAAASEAIGAQGIARYCITDEMILASISYARQGSLIAGARKKQKTPFLTHLIASVSDGFHRHALRLPHLLPILTALVSRLRTRVTEGSTGEVDETGRGQTAAQELLLDLVRDVGDLRTQNGFEEKAKVDEVVGMAIEVVGVQGILEALPLNIEPDANGNTPQPGRAHLLPLIRARTTNDHLAFFGSYFRPLSERVFARKVASEEAGKDSEAKIWEVIVGQIWDCCPGFCEMPRDMTEAMTTPFLTLITNLLYTQPILLPALLRGLSQLVSSTQTLLGSTAPSDELRKQFGLDQTSAAENMQLLRKLAKDMVSVLLNVFSKMPRESRGMVGDVISIWVGIMTEKDIIDTYTTVSSHLSQNIAFTTPAAAGISPISHTMLDLLIIFVRYLPAAQSIALFTKLTTPTLLEHTDATVQKKSYRVLKGLLEAKKVPGLTEPERLEQFVKRINEVGGGVGPGAQRDRLQLLSVVVDMLPKDQLHLIPELLSEAVLGTKEVNEKARDAGFDLILVMARKMAEGGTVRQAVDIADDEEMVKDGPAEADVEEYITMVAAGLTGTTPHMISASINALSRLVFEFKGDISQDIISELVSSVSIFVASKNREIVKSALGFVKVAVVALPLDTVTPHLHTLVPVLLGWVHDHKNHFKQKTVHIFERMIRKFGYDEIIQQAGAGGERKVLENIKRRKERAKRKKSTAAEGEEEQVPKPSSGNAYDDILYNSDSDLSSDGEADQSRLSRPVKPLNKKGKRGETAYLRHEGEQPMDLLSRSIAGGISSADPSAASRKRKPGQDAERFKTDKSGKLVITDDEAEQGVNSNGNDVAGSAFINATRGIDGARRDARGNLRFNKNTKRSRAQEQALGMNLDEVMGEKPKDRDGRKKKKSKVVGRLGEEFRARRAGGDIKRVGGVDPYAYVPIGQAARRQGRGGGGGGRGGRVSLTNKKRGSRA